MKGSAAPNTNGCTAPSCQAALIKQLASTDAKARNRSLRALLKTWLPAQAQVPEDEMRKLWKGLFYCVWHADKLPAQSHLIDTLSGLLLDLNLSVSVPYLSVFLLTMRREWAGIDFLRLDKFYLLIRRFVRGFFGVMRKNSWDLELVRTLMGILFERTFLAEDNLKGNGVNYHVASVFVEEIRDFLPLGKEVVEAVIGPFVGVFGRVSDKVLVGKVKGGVFDVLLKAGRELLEAKRAGNEVDLKGEAGLLGPVALGLGFSSRFYDLGSSVECCQGNRKAVFGLYGEFLTLEKNCVDLGVEILLPDVCDEEIPDLIPIDGTSMKVDGSSAGAVYSSEKGKRVKKKAKGSVGSGKKGKKKKKNVVSDFGTEDGDVRGNEETIDFSESVISNLQMQFEKVAAEVGLEMSIASCLDFAEVNASNARVTKKRKRVKGTDKCKSRNEELTEQKDGEGTSKTGEKSEKKVRFSMKNNLVWKPHSPLPPEDLRLPPSVTPRGSALKKGVPPGPIREIPAITKKVKLRAKLVKKGRKGILAVAPAIKRMKKLKSLLA